MAWGSPVSPFSGRLVPRYGSRVALIAGLLIAAAGCVPLLLLSDESPLVFVLLGTGMVGAGFAVGFPPATAVIMNDLGTEKAGDGAAVNQLARQVGGALGVAIVGSVFAAVYAADHDRQRRACRGRGVDPGRHRGCGQPARRGPHRPTKRGRGELRCGGPLGLCRLHGDSAPRGGECGTQAVGSEPGQAMSG